MNGHEAPSHHLLPSPTSRCYSRSKTEVVVRLGRNVLLLNRSALFEKNDWAGALLSFEIELCESFVGMRGHVSLRWQDIPVADFPIPSFAKKQINIQLLSFAIPSTLTLDVKIDHEFLIGNDFSQVGTDCAVLSNFTVRKASERLGNQLALIRSARLIADGFNLKGQYFTDERVWALNAQIRESLSAGVGFSVVRLGDGEGRVLAYPDHFTDEEVLSQVLYYHFGPESMAIAKSESPMTWINDSMVLIKSLLVRAVRNADIVGLPVADYFGEAEGKEYGQLGYAYALIYALSLTRMADPKQYVGTNVFQMAAARGLVFREAVAGAKRVYLVGPWDLRHELSPIFGRDDLQHVRVPGHYTWRGSKGLGQLPDLYRYVENKLVSLGELSGCLFLVGAGLFGKHYCNVIKNRGGVALDVGSVFDSWARKGRPEAAGSKTVDLAKFARRID